MHKLPAISSEGLNAPSPLILRLMADAASECQSQTKRREWRLRSGDSKYGVKCPFVGDTVAAL
jgi:hypothetical protein